MYLLFWLLIFPLLVGRAPALYADGSDVRFVVLADTAIEVHVGEELFTTWRSQGILNGVRLTRPVLWPVLSPRGNPVTRCWPLASCPLDEPMDHPHHQGLWLAFGKLVVGDEDTVDTWAVYRKLPWGPESTTRYRPGERGYVECLHTALDSANGILSVECIWKFETTRQPFLEEHRRMRFLAAHDWRAIDFVIRLKALERPVTFLDSKEGFLAVRVGGDLREQRDGASHQPGRNPGDACYLNAFGARREKEVWGRRSPWMALLGTLRAGEPLTIVFMDHPDNVNHPSPWMARGYGLFAVNPFGLADFTGGKQHFNFRLPAGGSVTFKYEILFYSAHLAPEEIEKLYEEFVCTRR